MTPTASPRFAWRRTLTSALATQMAAVVVISLTVVTALFVLALDRQLSAATDTRIRASAAGVARLGVGGGDGTAINADVMASLVADDAIVTLADLTGAAVAQFGQRGIDADAVLAATQSLRPGELASTSVDGVPLRLTVIEPTQLRVRTDEEDEARQISRVVIGVDTSADSQTVADLATVSIGIAAGSAAVLLVATWLATTRATRPLRAMARSASAIAAGDARGRMDESTRYRETDSLAAAMNDALETRERAEGAVRTFVADASHELRAPLTTIQGWTELALQRNDGPGALEALDRIELEARRMRSLVDSLALLARLDARPDLAHGTVDLAEIAQRVALEAREVSPDGSVEMSPVDGPSMVTGDSEQLRRVVRNLVGNSLQHAGPAAHTTIAVTADADRVVLRVTDDGVGIAPQSLSRAFDRFYTTSASESQNSGLGLAIVRGIVEAHHGSITLESPPSGGTTVIVDLPRAD